MSKRRKMVQSNLLKNSISAYFAAIEIHNKPNIPYRYETVTLLMMNAWELLLKSFIRKYIKTRSIFEDDGHTISLSKAITYVAEYINTLKPRSFIAIQENLKKIEEYRNNIAHFYNENLTPHIFMLVAKAALNYTEFVKKYFSKDVLSEEGLFILPLGFKLPFSPEDFLTKKVIESNSSPETRKFIESIVNVIKDLKDARVEESIILGFNIYLESVKKVANSDLLIAITNKDEADVTFTKTSSVRITNDQSAVPVRVSDEQLIEIFKYEYKQLVSWCRINILDFKQNEYFHSLMNRVKENPECAWTSRLNPRNPKTISQVFYSNKALEYIKQHYKKKYN